MALFDTTGKSAAELDDKYIMHTYGRLPLSAVSGKGATLTDSDGKLYVDFTSGIGVNSLGWCDDEWVASVTGQLNRFQHICNYYISPVTSAVAEKLCTLSGMSKVFFGNSGAEANEGAIKTARKYSFDRYGEGRYNIISLNSSFHGRTITTLAATGQDVFHHFFDPFTQGFRYVDMGDTSALDEATADGTVCAIMAEPIQGEGGVYSMPTEYAQYLRRLCDEKDILLIFDEVQCGIGRTGSLFAFENLGIKPDIVTMAKGLGGGLPIGAFMCAEKCADTMGASMHGSTFGGNPVSCAGAIAVLDRLTSEGFLDEVKAKGAYIRSRIEAENLAHVKEIRGAGLMLGIAVDLAPKDVLHKCFDDGLLVLTAGKDAVRLLPPLTISSTELEYGCDILINALR